MATIPQSPTTDFTSTTLDGSINDSVTTIAVNDASTINTPTYAVIDREDNNGVATPNQREVIYISDKASNNLTVTRGVNGSTARAHNDSAKLEPLITVGFWDDMYDAFTTAHTTTGNIVATSTATIVDINARSLALASVATVRRLVITESISVSGASQFGFSTGSGTGGYNGLFWVPGSLASQANVAGLALVPTTFTASFISAYAQTPASVASISCRIMRNGAEMGVVAILAGQNFASSSSLATTSLVAGDRLQLDINSTASVGGELSVLLRAA